MQETRLFIGGAWRGGNSTLAVTNPATGEEVGQVHFASRADMADALTAVKKGQRAWAAVAPGQRAAIMQRIAAGLIEDVDSIAAALTAEQGKTLEEARNEIRATAGYFSSFASIIGQIPSRIVPPDGIFPERRIIYEPIGPVFGICPWNLPAMMPGRKIANSLAAGCAIIVKPAKETPGTAGLIVKICEAAGVPQGVVNLVSGFSGELSETMIGSAEIRKVSFTGSTDVGKELSALAGQHMKKVAMELGGHAPVIVCEDVDAAMVAKQIAKARYSNAGQSCMAPTRFFVHRSQYRAFADEFAAVASAIKVGNGAHTDSQMGSLASTRRLAHMEELTADALSRGANLAAGGKRLGEIGAFFAPTVLLDVPDDARIMREEPFGPISPIQPFDTLDEVIAKANSTDFALCAYAYTHDLKTAARLGSEIEAGLIGINTALVAGPTTPFGGNRDSGIGREGALEGVLESMTTKTVSLVS